MKNITCFSTHSFEKKYLEKYAEKYQVSINYTNKRLSDDTVHLARESDAILCWANDKLDQKVLESLAQGGCKMVSLRSAGYSHLHAPTARKYKLTVTRVPSYSPESIAEHAVALYLSLNRKITKAHQRVRDFNFSLEGLEGHQIAGKTVGVIGAGLIGQAFIRIMLGFGCKVLIYDQSISPELELNPNISYTGLKELLRESDLISLHCPLTNETHHLLNKETLSTIKPTATLINTGRGGLIKTDDLIELLKEKKIAAVGLDVYEFEENIFFHDFSDTGIKDDELARLMSFPNALITSHQAFFTHEALESMAQTSIKNAVDFLKQSKIVEENIILD